MNTEKITSQAAARHVLSRHGFHFQKKYGQNFLLDVDLLDEIVMAADIGKEDYVVEIGPGMGSLTARLARRAKQVLAIEIDSNLIPILKETLADYDNIEIINADVMKTDLTEVLQGRTPVKFVANLPYYITTPIIMHILEHGDSIPYTSLTVMVQKEVAERMTCGPGGKDYGALTLAVQYYTSPEIIRYVAAEQFYPPPKVESAVVRLIRHETPPVEVKNERFMFSLIRAAFNQRRKTLVNGLHNGAGLAFSKEEYAAILEECGFEANIRGEKLSLGDFARLANLLEGKKG